MTKIELVKAKTFELDPKKTYLILMDNQKVTKEDAHNLMTKLGLKNAVGMVFDGDPNDVIYVVEAP